MLRFTVRRLLQMVVTVVAATFIFFTAFKVLPGDPVRGLFGFSRPPPELYDLIVRQYHLDEPFLVQYGLYVGGILTGDLGHSLPHNPYGTRLGAPVSQTLKATLPVSLRILGATIALQTVVGLAVGAFAALRARRASGVVTHAAAVFVVAVPVIVLAYAGQSFLGFQASWFPGVWERDGGWLNYVLPIVALAAGSAAYVALITRSQILGTLQRPFIKAAHARGIRRRRVVGVHAMRPSLVPVITLVTANLGGLITGLVVVEGVFRVPGAGRELLLALQRHDQALVMVMLMLILVVVIVANTIADIAYHVIDPRIRLEA